MIKSVLLPVTFHHCLFIFIATSLNTVAAVEPLVRTVTPNVQNTHFPPMICFVSEQHLMNLVLISVLWKLSRGVDQELKITGRYLCWSRVLGTGSHPTPGMDCSGKSVIISNLRETQCPLAPYTHRQSPAAGVWLLNADDLEEPVVISYWNYFFALNCLKWHFWFVTCTRDFR